MSGRDEASAEQHFSVPQWGVLIEAATVEGKTADLQAGSGFPFGAAPPDVWTQSRPAQAPPWRKTPITRSATMTMSTSPSRVSTQRPQGRPWSA